MAAGPIRTINSGGKMNKIIGTVMIAGRAAAFSSAFIMRSLRISLPKVRKAAASGVPVLAYARGGALETVRQEETGLLFNEQTPEALAAAILKFEEDELRFNPAAIRAHAEKFSEQQFRSRFMHEVEQACQAVAGI